MKKDFAVYLTIYGHWPAIAGVLIRSQDQIIMSCLALMMAILAKQQEACKVLYETEGLQGFILSVFNQEQDPFDMPKNQRDATITNTLKEVAQEAGIVRRGQRVLLSSILLQMLASLSDNMAAYIGSKSPSTNLLVDDVLTKSLEFLIMDMAWLRQTSEYPNCYKVS
ncbi:hypothetical protein BGW41_000634 [Actinomortierella wolfii]|nr:hypothetical protein BGW41_000634 [Actinomortierella wolfii]